MAWLYSGTMKNSEPVIDDFDLSLYNNQGKLIVSSSVTNQNIEFIKYKIQEEGFYSFKINQFSNHLSSYLTELAFTSSVGKD